MALCSNFKKGIACLTTIFMIATPTFAETTTRPLSLDYAVEMGISMDDKLPEYSRKITLYETCKGDYESTGAYECQQYNIYIDQYNTSKTYRKDVVKRKVLESYQNIILLQENIKLGTDQIALQEKLIKQYEIKLKNGMCDQLTYDKQVQALEDLKTQKEKNTKDLATAKSDFLRLTNLNLDTYTYEPDYTYEELKITETPIAYASGMAGELIKYQKRLAELADTNFWDTIYNAGPGGTGPTYSTYLKQKVNVADALDLVDSNYKSYKSAIENQFTTTINSFNDIATKKAAYEAAQTDLKALDIKHKAGYVSDFDYEKQLLNIESEKFEYLNAVYKYNSNKFQLEHPWSMSMLTY